MAEAYQPELRWLVTFFCLVAIACGFPTDAQAQRRISVNRLATEPVAVGEELLVRMALYDDALSLDPDVVEVDPTRTEGLGLRTVAPGVATVMVLRGGISESIIITVQGRRGRRESFNGFGPVAVDGVPSWGASSFTQVTGASNDAPAVLQGLGGRVGYTDDESGVRHLTEVMVQSVGVDQWGAQRLSSSSVSRRFDLHLGDFMLTPAPGRVAFGMRGVSAAVRPLPGEDGGPLEIDLNLGGTWQLNCCGLFNPNGEVLAAGGATLQYGAGATRVHAGAIVPRRDFRVLPLLGVEQRLELGDWSSAGTFARVGDGFSGSLRSSYRSERTLFSMVGFGSTAGTWIPTVGESRSGSVQAVGLLDHALSDRFTIGGTANYQESRDGPLPLSRIFIPGVQGSFGGKTRVSARYALAMQWERGVLDTEQLQHVAQLGASSYVSGGFRFNGVTSLSFDPRFRPTQVFARAAGESELGPVIRLGPNAWGTYSEGSASGGLGMRFVAERARVRIDNGLSLLSAVASGKVDAQGALDSNVQWTFASWGALSAGGNLSVPLRQQPLRYSGTVGLRVGGNIRDVRGLLTGGGRVQGIVFVDEDGDGVMGEGEYGVQGIEITVLDRTVVTGEGGEYTIRGLDPTTYSMSVDAAGYLLANGAAPDVTVAGLRPTTVDIPLTRRRRLAINVFADVGGDGELSVGDWGVEAEMVTLTGPDGTVQTIEVPDGVRTLQDLPLGRYEVELVAALVDELYLPTGRTKQTIYVDQRGFQRVEFPVQPVRKLAGKVCRDANGNERYDGADPCDAGIQVALSTGEVVTTNTGGRFFFEPVPPGQHRLMVEGVESEAYTYRESPRIVDDALILLPVVEVPAPVSASGVKSDATLAALRLEVDGNRVKVGERIPFSVTATFSDLSQMELDEPLLTISDESVLRRDGDVLVALREGTARVKVIQGSVQSPPVEIDVQLLPVVGLIARPSRIEVPFGEVQQVGAAALYVDGDSQEVGSRVEWTCDDPQVCRVEGNGVFVAVGPGSSILRARYLGVSSQPIEVRVTTGDAIPTKMVVSPPQLTLGIQSTGRVYVDADLSNGRAVQLTTEVEWDTDAPDVIKVLPGGRIRPIGIGTATVTASYKGVESVASTIQVVPAVGLVVVPTVGVVPAGVSVPIKLYEVLGDGSFAEASRAKWSSDAPAVAEVEDGVVKTNQIGVASLTAKYRGNTSLPMEVRVVGSGLGGLRSSTERLVLNPGDVSYVDSIAEFRDGTETLATSVSDWTVSNPAVATVTADGEVQALAPGRAIIRGSWLGWSTAPIEVLVGAGVSDVPSAILVEPGQVSLSAQGRQPLAVTMLSEDGRLLSAEGVRWEIADPSVAWVEDSEIRAVSVGSTEIVAVLGDVRSLPVPVEVAPIVGVTAAPALGRLPVGARVALKAVGVVGNGEIEELRDGVTWSSSNPDVLKIDSRGELLAFRAGRAQVTASWRGMETLSMPVEVADSDITGLSIEPDGASVRVNERLPLAVVAVFGDGRTADASPHVTWTSTRPSVAATEDGLLVGLEPGVAEVFATWMGVKSDPVRVNVAPADAVGVIIGNASETMLVGRRQPLEATAVTADGLLLDATEQTLWGVKDDAVVTVDANGYIEALSAGQTTVVGIVGGEESPPIAVEVVDSPVTRVDLKPGAIAVLPGDPVTLRATATLQDGRTVDVTAQVDWEIDGRGVAVDRYNRLQAVAGARARIRARLQSESEDIRSGWAEVVAETGVPSE